MHEDANIVFNSSSVMSFCMNTTIVSSFSMSLVMLLTLYDTNSPSETKIRVITVQVIEAILKLKLRAMLLAAPVILLPIILNIFTYFVTSFQIVSFYKAILNYYYSFFHSIYDVFIMSCHHDGSS